MQKLLLASFNRHKLKEIADILAGYAEVLSPDAVDYAFEPEENAPTLEGNALIKARSLYQFAGLPCLADDTGLEVEALGGAPGVHSARFAGESHDDVANRQKLLTLLLDMPPPRKARFRTAIAYIDSFGKEYLFEGIVTGTIALEERGVEGFGYDSLFIPDGYNSTFAEMSDQEKNAISHRSRAVSAFAHFLLPSSPLSPKDIISS